MYSYMASLLQVTINWLLCLERGFIYCLHYFFVPADLHCQQRSMDRTNFSLHAVLSHCCSGYDFKLYVQLSAECCSRVFPDWPAGAYLYNVGASAGCQSPGQAHKDDSHRRKGSPWQRSLRDCTSGQKGDMCAPHTAMQHVLCQYTCSHVRQGNVTHMPP
jgi:hypothetical protein